MRKKAVSRIMLAALLTSMLTFAFNIQSVKANPIMVSVDYHGSPNIIDPRLTPGTQFTIGITLDYVYRLWGFQFTMNFNASVLHGISTELGPFLKSTNAPEIIWISLGFNNTKGALEYSGATIRPGLPFKYYPSGGGVLATVTFEVVGIGSSPISFGLETALMNITGGYQLRNEAGEWEWCYGWFYESLYEPPWWIKYPYQPWRDILSEGSGYFDNTPPQNPIEATQLLTEEIESWDLPEGTENTLTSKLNDVIHLVDKGNDNGAIHKLMDFINQVEALRGKKLTDDQADQVVEEAQRIIDLINE